MLQFLSANFVVKEMIFYPPPPLTKSTPPLRSNPGSATEIDRSGYLAYNSNRPTGLLLDTGFGLID